MRNITSIFKVLALSTLFFLVFFAKNADAQVSITVPIDGSEVYSWVPVFDFGGYESFCDYSYDNSTWNSMPCNDIPTNIAPPPYNGSFILYLRGFDINSIESSASTRFTFSGYGCTDSAALNFNSNATIDNGSCYYLEVTSPADGSIVNTWTGVSVSWGNFGPRDCHYSYNNSGLYTGVDCTQGGVGIPEPPLGPVVLSVKSASSSLGPFTSEISFTYSKNVSITAPTTGQTVSTWSPVVDWGSFTTTCEYSYDNSTWNTITCSNNGSDIPTPSAGSVTLYVRGNDGSTSSDANVSFEYVILVPGCMDSNALNYDPDATTDDGSCTYVSIQSPNGNVSIWSPSVTFASIASSCFYKIDTGVWNSISCSSSGADIPASSYGAHILYVMVDIPLVGQFTSEISFTYSKNVSITAPTTGQTVSTWSPVVDWGSFTTTCEYSYDNSTWNTITCSNNGSDIPTPSAGSVTLYVRGNDGSTSSDANVSFEFSVQTTTPSAPDLSSDDDLGSSNSDNITSRASSLTLTGTGIDGTTVTVCKGGCTNQVLGTVNIDNTGTWSFDLPTLSQGTHSITVTYEETGKSVSEESSALSITVDTTAPSAPGTPDVQSLYDTGYSNTDNVSFVGSVVLDISCGTGNTVVLFVDNTSNQSGTCSSGTISFTVSGLVEGIIAFTATQSDTAGNTSSASTALSYTYDATAPSITSIASSTLSTSATISWSTNVNSTSTVEYGLTTGYGLIVSSSTFATNHSLQITGLSALSTYNFKVSSTDLAGNRATSTNKIFVTTAVPDTTSPTVQTITASSTTMTITMSESLSSTSTPSSSSFTLGGTSAVVSLVQVSGSVVTLTVSPAILSTETVTVSYSAPLTDMLQDGSGNTVASFTNHAVTNQTSAITVVDTTPAVEQPRVGPTAVSSSGGGSFTSTQVTVKSNSNGQPKQTMYPLGTTNGSTGASMNNGYGGLTKVYSFKKNVGVGTKNSEVINLQRFLNSQGFTVNPVLGGAGSPGSESNVYGLLTKKALAQFQKSVGIPPVGQLGPMTRLYINNYLKTHAPAK